MIMLLNFIVLPNLDDWTKKIKDCIFCSQQLLPTILFLCPRLDSSSFLLYIFQKYPGYMQYFFSQICKANIVKIMKKSSWFLYCSLLSNSSASALLWCSCRSKVALHPPFCYPISYILLLACRTRIAWNQNYFLPEGAIFSTKLSGSC